ncbi:hypothetical protein MKEN_01161100 [Mycena kentingensis (nom. inval.)]|nr:hypothetical protein MKEN_01161100 [Mycena kentingensis (nom. inval.)]
MPSVVIVGAGIGGVSFAIALRSKLNVDDFIIYEKASDVGGTWRDNIYPGASSDVGMHFYSLSTDLNPDWPSTHGSQKDTQKYWSQLASKYAIYPKIQFNTRVISATWSREKLEYDIVVEDVVKGERSRTSARVLISAVGLLEVPRFPDISGVDTFAGPKFHSARWDTGVNLAGKRVAVIGNGASSTQFVPIISEDPSVQVTQFCRTPNWLLPPIRADYSDLEKWSFRNVPFLMRFYRFLLYLRSELLYTLVFARKYIRDNTARGAKSYIVQNAPKELLEHLVPKYSLGCKRVIFDTDFLKSLHRPNMKLNWDGIQSISEDGVITSKGQKLSFDVMIFATGFTADRYPLHVIGDEGISVQKYYDSQGGPKGYLGTTIPGFPNLFLIAGPNTTTGHTSVILTEEIQINYILKFVQPLLANEVKAFSITPIATDAYNALIHERLARSVFVQCISWYRTGGEGKVSSIFPGPMALYQWWMRRPMWEDYEIMGATEEWKAGVWWGMILRMVNPFHYLGLLVGWFLAWVSL